MAVCLHGAEDKSFACWEATNRSVGWRDGWRDGNWSQDGNRGEGTVKWEMGRGLPVDCLLLFTLSLSWSRLDLWSAESFLGFLEFVCNFWGWHTYWKSCLLLEMPVYSNISFNSPTPNNWLLTNSFTKRTKITYLLSGLWWWDGCHRGDLTASQQQRSITFSALT